MRFSYVSYDEIAQEKQQRIKKLFEVLEAEIDELEHGRAKALVMTKLEEAYMWAGKSIRDSQISRTKICEEKIERGE